MKKMTFRQFSVLVKPNGECSNVDYKFECHAFNKKTEENAELLKDIIAMANNGRKASYLFIGVSNDGRGFKSIANTNLTDENLQRLCRDNIYPMPMVRLSKLSFSQLGDKNLVVIQIGPNPTQCFRFAKDMGAENYSYRKHLVWVRRGSTSDLASPEEIKRLLEGKPPIEDLIDVDDNTTYDRVPVSERKLAVEKDLLNYIRNIARGDIRPYGKPPLYSGHDYRNSRAILNINNMTLKLNIFIVDKCLKSHNEIIWFFNNDNHISHATLVISMGNVTQNSVESSPHRLKESWGYICADNSNWYIYSRNSMSFFKFPPNIAGNRMCFILKNCNDTQNLYKNLARFLGAISSNPEISNFVSAKCKHVNSEVMIWLQDGCPIPKYNAYKQDGVKLNKNEFLDEEKYGTQIMLRQTSKELDKELLEFLL